jgi:hypothetical protein
MAITGVVRYPLPGVVTVTEYMVPLDLRMAVAFAAIPVQVNVAVPSTALPDVNVGAAVAVVPVAVTVYKLLP